MSERLVAIDGGGSKTDYLLADLVGHVLKTVHGAPTTVTAGGLGQAGYNLREGLHQLLETEPKDTQIKVLSLAISGLDTAKDLDAARRVFHEVLDSTWAIDQLVLTNDAVAALVNGTATRPAIVVIGGTGSNCLGWNAAGQTHRVSGLDYVLSDEGSGYDAGHLALRAAVRSADGRGPRTRLEAAVFRHFDVRTLGELKDEIYSPLISKDEIASFAKTCVQLASDGDTVATQIINHCISQLILDVRTVASKLNCLDREFALVPTGTFLLSCLDQFRDQLTASKLPARIIIPETPPVHGALTIAQEILRGRDAQDFLILA